MVVREPRGAVSCRLSSRMEHEHLTTTADGGLTWVRCVKGQYTHRINELWYVE